VVELPMEMEEEEEVEKYPSYHTCNKNQLSYLSPLEVQDNCPPLGQLMEKY